MRKKIETKDYKETSEQFEERKKTVTKIRDLVKAINTELTKKVRGYNITDYDLAGIFKKMFMIYELAEDGTFTVYQSTDINTSQIFHLLDWLM
jgi:hypothetical protein